MGFFSRLFGMPSFAGSTNVLLVELTLPELSDAQRAELKTRVLEFLQNTGPLGTSLETALVRLNEASRMTQLNLLAIAMKELGYKPVLSTERFRKIKDPFAHDLVDEHALRAVARRLKWAHGVEPNIEAEPINFESW
ncbi:MAG: hypothetical protein OEY86_17695 [Nitrospira sp.]|nr:hypothetical protein [Nitrospira sp.]